MTNDSMPKMLGLMKLFPVTIRNSDSLKTAHNLMIVHNIHHLPVFDDNEDDIVSIISIRDIERTMSFGHHEVETGLLVSDISSPRAYIADVLDPIDKVLDVMADKRLSAVLVGKNGEMVGIFTATDACRLYAEQLRLLHSDGALPEGKPVK